MSDSYALSTSFEAVKNALCIGDYLRDQGVELRQGRAKCPVHSGDNPHSFSVDLEQQVFHCFSCGSGGDVITLCQGLEGGEPWEAMGALAMRYGIDLPARSDNDAWCKRQKEKEALRKALCRKLTERRVRRYYQVFASRFLANTLDEQDEQERSEDLWDSLWSVIYTSTMKKLEEEQVGR